MGWVGSSGYAIQRCFSPNGIRHGGRGRSRRVRAYQEELCQAIALSDHDGNCDHDLVRRSGLFQSKFIIAKFLKNKFNPSISSTRSCGLAEPSSCLSIWFRRFNNSFFFI